jgi:tRNA threonylcarbamoyladenosine biosynthesis protein TsaB
MLMMILAIETSSELASVALMCGDEMLVREASGVQTHSQTLLPMVQSVLAQAGVVLAECDALAFGSGPGSFTGVRTACGIAQGLAFGLDLPVLPIVTLQAMAQACREAAGGAEMPDILCILDARMGEVYWAQYHHSGTWRTVIEPTLSAPSAVVPEGRVLACGNGLTAYASWFEARAFAHDARPDCMPHAAQVARLASNDFMLGKALPARDAQPLYLRNKVALTTSERLAKVRA